MASSTSRGGAEAVPPVLPSIPLAPEPVKPLSEQSIGNLVKEATAHVSTLVRAEVAKMIGKPPLTNIDPDEVVALARAAAFAGLAAV